MIFLLGVNPTAIFSVTFSEPLSSVRAIQSTDALSTSSYPDKRDLVLQSIYSEADYLLAGQNKNYTDRFAYGDFYRTWWTEGQWHDPEEARAQEPVYVLAWLYTYDERYQNNQTVLSTIIRAIDRYCRWQIDGRSGEIGLTQATTAFMASVLRAYRLIQNVDLGKITEFNNTLGDLDDVNSDYELYLTPSDRWILGDGFRTAIVDNDYFVLYTTAPAQNRRVFFNPIGWLDIFEDGYVDFDFYLSIQFFDDFTGNIPIKIQDRPNGDWNNFPVVANITGKASGRWEWSNFTVMSDKLWIDGNDKISFSIENRLAPFKIKQIMVQIDRRDFWIKKFENAGDYLNTRFDNRGLNHEAGALYSLYVLYNITGDARFLDYYNKKMSRFQSYQWDGVIPEINEVYCNDTWWRLGYDGDYIHVSMYWLTMLHKETQDESVFQMLNSSVNFMAYLYFPEGRWEAGFSTRAFSSSPFAEAMAPLYMIPYFAMSQKNGYAARIAEIYYEQIYFNNLSSGGKELDWYRHSLNPVCWVDLYDSLVPDPNPEGFRLPIESKDWYLKDFPRIKILVVKTPKYATFLSYGNTTTANALADLYDIENGKHVIASRGNVYSPWGFGVISLNDMYYNTYEIEPTLVTLKNTSDVYIVRIVGLLKTPAFTAAPVSFEMTYNFFYDSISLSINIGFDEDVKIEKLNLGATPVNPSQLNLTLMNSLAKNVSLENDALTHEFRYKNVASISFGNLSIRPVGSPKTLAVVDMSNETLSSYGPVEYVGWVLSDAGYYFREDNIAFTIVLTLAGPNVGKEIYQVDSLRTLIFVLLLANIFLGGIVLLLALLKVHALLKRRSNTSKPRSPTTTHQRIEVERQNGIL